MARKHSPLLLLLVALALALVGLGAPASSSPSSEFVRPYWGDGQLPAGCVVDRDPLNPDNLCYHMKVGLNALDSPKVDVDVLVPVSPAAERDMRVAEQAVMMWDGGLHYLADQMDLPWLQHGFEMDVRTHQVVVDAAGALEEPLSLVDPEIVVVVSNPAGGIGIGIDPVSFAGELGIVDGEGTPCASVPDPLDFGAWQDKPGFDQHGQEKGGIYVEDCGGVGGNVCFAVNGAVDPVPGASDFFGLFDLVAHEFGHCLTLGHVGDGADGPWGPTPTNDIMAYSTDPPGVAKCVSTLDVEGFALRMSRYLDVNGDGSVDQHDHLVPNDAAGDGLNSFQVQHPDDHHYASSTGDPADCPQPELGPVPLSYGDWSPKPVATTKPLLRASSLRFDHGRLHVRGTATNVPLVKGPTQRTAAATDATSDSPTPVTDLTGVKVSVTRTMVNATMSVSQVWPVSQGTSATAYSLLVSGRRFDSFIGTGDTSGTPKVMDNGTGYYLPDGTATWDYDDNTVTFHVRRDYLADQHIHAPYTVNAITGLHARANDWIATTDSAPDGAGLRLAAPPMGPETRDAPVARTVRTSHRTLTPDGGATVLPSDSTLGVGLVSTVDTRDYFSLPIERQATAKVTLSWTGSTVFGLSVNGGSGQQVEERDGSITVSVPWARRDLSITVDPQEVLEPTTYTLTADLTTVKADKDGDRVPDVADRCPARPGPSTGAGCPDTDADGLFDRTDACPAEASTSATGCPTRADERIVLTVDGKRVDSQSVVTRHGAALFALGAEVRRGAHRLVLAWVRDGEVIARVTRRVD
jgi:hypothetical protein